PGDPGSPVALPEDPLALPEQDPETFRRLIASLRPTPVVVNIWGSWCPPCREEAPVLARISEKYEGRVRFIGVDILDEREAAREFIREYGWTYPSVFDPQARIRDEMGYVGQPITVIHDREGEIAFEWNGAISAERLEAEIQKVL
ncbi:MAG TPA: TlpA disulfide reductase family protein, partial [Actinomycetota bacterium]|nr:TlpA disulfide reductase family protein [Actinomycetota bacterium]